MDNVVIPPVTQRDPASPTSPKARTVGTEKAGGEKDMTHPQANVSMWLFPTQLWWESQCCLYKVKAMSFRIMRIPCSLIKPHRCLERVDEPSAAGAVHAARFSHTKDSPPPPFSNFKEKGHPVTQAAWMRKDLIGLSQMWKRGKVASM